MQIPLCHVVISYGTREQRGPTSPSGHWDSVSGAKLFESSIIKQKHKMSPQLRQGINKHRYLHSAFTCAQIREVETESGSWQNWVWRVSEWGRFLQGNKSNTIEEERSGAILGLIADQFLSKHKWVCTLEELKWFITFIHLLGHQIQHDLQAATRGRKKSIPRNSYAMVLVSKGNHFIFLWYFMDFVTVN